MDIHIRSKYASIDPLSWEGVPSFAVLTGENGAGKTQLLEAIAIGRGVHLHNPYAHQQHPNRNQNPKVEVNIQGADFQQGEVFHSYSNWIQLAGGASGVDQIKREIAALESPSSPQHKWARNRIATAAGLAEGSPLSIEVIEDHVTPALLWGANLPGSSQNLAFLFLAYRILCKQALELGRSNEQIIAQYGKPPWESLNEILVAAGLPFEVIGPEDGTRSLITRPESYALRMRDIQRNEDVPFEKISSGERVIMSTVLWIYGVQTLGRHYKLFLLDEPDAHLHPSMTKRFLDVVQNVFVRRLGVSVIMSTHSPSTVALVDESSLFEMHRTGQRIRRPSNRNSAITRLTEGFVVVHDGMAVVLCEGKYDVPFYSAVRDRLIQLGSSSAISREPALAFMTGTGIGSLTALLPQLRSIGLKHFHGLIDRDKNNKPGDGLHVLGRTMIENYLFDPINVYHSLHDSQRCPHVDGINIQLGQRVQIAQLPEADLQRIADVVLGMAQTHLPNLSDDETKTAAVSFVTGQSLRYPNWLLIRHKDDLWKAFKGAFPAFNGGHYESLITSFAALSLIPTDLQNVMGTIQREITAVNQQAATAT